MRWKCPTPLHSLLLISLLVVAEAVPIDKIKSVDMEMPARDTMEPHLNGERPGFLYSRCCRDLHVNIVLQQPSEQAGGYERFHGAIQKRREFLLVSWPTISQDTGLYYDRYLREVIDVLETDKHFRERLQTADIEEIKAGKLSKELNLVSHMVRSKLDELKRQEVSRLRMLIKAKMDAHRGKDIKVDHQALLKQFDHLNHQNPHSFEAEDLEMLIKTATTDLESFDRERHEEFKQYEMLKEHERREYLKTLDEGRRKEEEMRFDEMRRKHKDHPKVHHPGSMDQLKEVWEETDGLDPDDFDPKTFFKLHDSNGDRFLDEQELEALFTKELEKIYDPNNVEDDMVEMEEERLRMREHVMNEVDVNKDRLISMEEFLNASEKKDFIDPENWETLDEQEHYSESELRQFEIQLSKQQDELNKKSHELMKQHDELRSQHDQLQAQKHELYQAMQQMEQKKHFQQQGQNPGGPKIELKFHPAEQQSNPPENLKPPTSAKANVLDKVHNLIQDKAHDPVQDLNPAATTDPRHDGALH